MGRGRKPLPTAIKKKKGTYRKDQAIENEMTPKLVKNIPSPPDTLNKVAKAEWYRLIGELSRLKVLSHMDLSLIEVYCKEYAVYLEMNELLEKNGRVMVYKNDDGTLKHVQVAPHQRIADRAVEKMLKIAAEFGFSPSARTRISMAQTQIPNTGQHPLVKALNKK